jgi:ornithine carbamoyltransferase
MQAAEIFGFELTIATPNGYEPNQSFVERYQNNINYCSSPMDACEVADLVVTDVWTSMGKELEQKQRESAFKDYQIDQKMMSVVNSDALFMHCLPAHRGEEVSADVIDGKRSMVWDEAENRLHVQKALLLYLIEA